MGKVNKPGSQNSGGGGGNFRRIAISISCFFALLISVLFLLAFLPIIVGVLWCVLPRQRFDDLLAPVLRAISDLWRGVSSAFKGVVPSRPVRKPSPEALKPPERPIEEPSPKEEEELDEVDIALKDVLSLTRGELEGLFYTQGFKTYFNNKVLALKL